MRINIFSVNIHVTLNNPVEIETAKQVAARILLEKRIVLLKAQIDFLIEVQRQDTEMRRHK